MHVNVLHFNNLQEIICLITFQLDRNHLVWLQFKSDLSKFIYILLISQIVKIKSMC